MYKFPLPLIFLVIILVVGITGLTITKLLGYT